MEGLLVLLVLAVLAVPVLLVIALSSVSGLKRRVAELENQVADLMLDAQRRGDAHDAGQAEAARQAPPSPPSPAAATSPAAPAAPASPGTPAGTRPPPIPASAPVAARTELPESWQPPPPAGTSRKAPRTDWMQVAGRRIRQWFSTGNVPVKVGMLVLLAGVAALLKYASDQGWLRMPIELRLAGVALAALAALVFGWRKRVAKPAFARALQGGAIGILLLVVFAAAKMYGLMPMGLAFGISVVLIAGLGVLAVLQDSRTLAVLGVLAGFLAPIWLSDGSGNHVALFSYYAVLNLAIFGVAWVKPWRVLFLLGFVFTWGIGIAWGVLKYRAEFFASTEPFLLLFFAIYLLIPVLHARRRAPRLRDPIDGCLLFGTPLVAFSAQAGLMPDRPMTLAFCAVALAAVYAALAWWERSRERYVALFEAHALLAVGFATLAVPLAFSARVTAAVFALEGAALVMFGLRQMRRVPLWTGAGLQLAAGAAYAMGNWNRVVDGAGSVVAETARPILNGPFMSGLIIAVAGFASAWALWRSRHGRAAALALAWGLVWWLGIGAVEIDRFAAYAHRPDWWLLLAAVTAWGCAEAGRLQKAWLPEAVSVAALAMALPIALWQSAVHAHPFAGMGGVAWAVYLVLGLRSLMCLRSGNGRIASWAQWVWWLVWPLALSLLGEYLAQRAGLAQGWRYALIVLPWLAVSAVLAFRPEWLGGRRGATLDPASWRPWLGRTYALLLGLAFAIGLFVRGDASPLPWLPLINPLELTQQAILILGVHVLTKGSVLGLRSHRALLIGLVALTWVSSVALRAVHFWGGVPWDAALLSSSLAQTTLTVLWSVLGVVGWVVGSRRGQRGLWLAAAVLMGVVLAKLVLVDRQHLGNLLGIGSFIAYGLLCTVVGYLAPAPPRSHEETST
ncbi:MAG: DUF2339 domain-containing protein [Xanthomonadaceae bacterium]|nr:DUF2339 domain-containing protein [Xanthomonadaceae bacterium]